MRKFSISNDPLEYTSEDITGLVAPQVVSPIKVPQGKVRIAFVTSSEKEVE